MRGLQFGSKEFWNCFRETCFLRTLVCCRADVFALKKGLDGPMRRKARLVVCGNYERNMDLNTYAATSRAQSLRAFCAKAALHKLRIPPMTFKECICLRGKWGCCSPTTTVELLPGTTLQATGRCMALVDSATRKLQRRQHLCFKALASLAAKRTNVCSR